MHQGFNGFHHKSNSPKMNQYPSSERMTTFYNPNNQKAYYKTNTGFHN